MAKKIKKVLKNVAKVGIPMLALAGLMKGRQGKAFTNADARKLMTTNKAMRNSMLQNAPVTQEELMDFGNDQGFGFGLMAKKGGRIVKGKKAAVRTTKGFSKTKKKQANRMRKK